MVSRISKKNFFFRWEKVPKAGWSVCSNFARKCTAICLKINNFVSSSPILTFKLSTKSHVGVEELIFAVKSKIALLVFEWQLGKSCTEWQKIADFAMLSFIHQQWDLTFDTKNQFLDPNLVGFGSLNVKIGLELTKLWQYWFSSKSPYIFWQNYYINFNPLAAPFPNPKKNIFLAYSTHH